MKPAGTPAEKTGAAALAAAAVLAAAYPPAAALPLAVFVGACAAAPFLPGVGFFMPVVSRGPRNRPAAAVTFDDGPDPETTPALLDLLDHCRVKAAFFVVGRRVDAHPALAKELVRRGHAVGCHSYDHDVLLGMKRPQTVQQDLQKSVAALARIGVRPLAFRPPVGILTPRIAAGLTAAGMYVLTFSRRGWDAGNRRLSGLSERILRRVRPGDVILLHDTPPRGAFDKRHWLSEVEAVIEGARRRGLSVVSLETLIGRPIMETAPEAGLENH
jgi:peptidoglycan/xylan/chitin deacetylase (PgdA/CDA1 family)